MVLFMMTARRRRSTLFPYTTLFRSDNLQNFGFRGRPEVQERLAAAFEQLYQGSADRKSTRLNSSHRTISYAVFCLKKKTMIALYVSSHSVCLSEYHTVRPGWLTSGF